MSPFDMVPCERQQCARDWLQCCSLPDSQRSQSTATSSDDRPPPSLHLHANLEVATAKTAATAYTVVAGMYVYQKYIIAITCVLYYIYDSLMMSNTYTVLYSYTCILIRGGHC